MLNQLSFYPVQKLGEASEVITKVNILSGALDSPPRCQMSTIVTNRTKPSFYHIVEVTLRISSKSSCCKSKK